MLLRYLYLLQQDPVGWVALLVASVIGVVSAVTVHEAAHAWTALQLGDPTAARQGRVSLDPRRHIDPAGGLLFLLAFVGWGKPTPVNPANIRGNPLAGMALVSGAGPVSNILTAAVLGIPFRLGLLAWQRPFTHIPFSGGDAPGALGDVLAYAVLFNAFLAIFNLIPLPPLDGFTVALGVLPRDLARRFATLQRYGAMPLLALLLLDFATPVGIFSNVIVPVVNIVGMIAVGHNII